MEDPTDTPRETKHHYSKKILKRIKLTVIVVVIFIVGSTIFLSPVSSLSKADAIVAISGGDTAARTMKAVDLYHAGWAPRIIFSGAAADPESPSNAEVMKQIAQANGVPLSAIETDKVSRNTHQNAQLSRGLLSKERLQTIILVTSQYHQRRASIEFAHSLGKGVAIINQPSNDFYWSKYAWWTSLRGWYLTCSELVKIPFVMIRGY